MVNIGTRGFKMHSQARAFFQPTRANIHQYQFNNPILFPYKWNQYNIIFNIMYTEIHFKGGDSYNYNTYEIHTSPYI